MMPSNLQVVPVLHLASDLLLFVQIRVQSAAAGYEMLVQQLLNLPHRPAVIVVRWWGPRHAYRLSYSCRQPHVCCLLCRFGVDPHQQQQGYEMLVQKLPKLPHRPAVIIVHW